MLPQQFAIAIVLPNATSLDIVTAAIKYKVHIIDKEDYDERKDYTLLPDLYLLPDGNTIRLLFVIAKGEYILAETTEEVASAKMRAGMMIGIEEREMAN